MIIDKQNPQNITTCGLGCGDEEPGQAENV